jgi:hypothetical protein
LSGQAAKSSKPKPKRASSNFQQGLFGFFEAVFELRNLWFVKAMEARLAWALVAIAVVAAALVASVPTSYGQDADVSFKLLNQSDGNFSYTLNVAIPQSLNEYYRGLGHGAASDSDFAKFVTPNALKPIADALRQIYPDDEDFANGVLTLVHQMPYQATLPEYYPVETLTQGKGDCDMFSLFAASVLEAGSLDVVLLHYTQEEHMNIGVHLNTAPKDARSQIYSEESGNVTYYVAECTSSNWQEGWRVGECPNDLENTPLVVVPLENVEEISPGQVSASFKQLALTTFVLEVSPAFALEGGTVTVKGQVSPCVAGENVTIYQSSDGSSWTVLDTAAMQADGQFSFLWKATGAGSLSLRASWRGNDVYAGATSKAKNAFVLPVYLLASIAALIIAVTVLGLALLVRRKRKRKLPKTVAETEPPLPPVSEV